FRTSCSPDVLLKVDRKAYRILGPDWAYSLGFAASQRNKQRQALLSAPRPPQSGSAKLTSLQAHPASGQRKAVCCQIDKEEVDPTKLGAARSLTIQS
ncbi:hypothetical protein KIN20_035068, partial [Parelaphostrongylus tenuis]